MADIQEAKEKNTKLKFSSVTKDLVLIGSSIIIILMLSYFLKVFEFLVLFFQKFPKAITWIDEIISGLLTLSIGLTFFSWRRWYELKKETAERIKKQEELLMATETRAAVEKIISRQVRTDIDEIKRELQEILQLLLNRRK